MLLEIKGLTKRFGGVVAVNGFDAYIDSGEIVGLIGPNGAGKSTLFNLITGVNPPTRGRIIFNGNDITKMKPHQIAVQGIGRTFQLNPLFGDFTVLQNVVTSFHLHPKSSLFDMYFSTRKFRRNEAYIMEQSMDILRMVGLDRVKDELAKNLPHGYQKMLGVARALATRPRIMLLDEPLGGMNPVEIDFSLKSVKKMQQNGITILIVEHNMQILDLCDRIIVISFGQKIFEGSAKEVRENDEVIMAYFGGEHAA